MEPGFRLWPLFLGSLTMLEVEYKGTERFTRLSQLEVVDGILRGEINHDSPARRSNPDWANRDTTTYVPLTVEALLDSQEQAILSDRLLQEIHRFYSASNTGLALVPSMASKAAAQKTESPESVSPAVALAADVSNSSLKAVAEPLGLHRMHACAVRLAKWKWTDLKIKLRILFLQAWLTELVGDLPAAREHYKTYLQCISEKSEKLVQRKDKLQAQLDLDIEPQLTVLALNNLAVLSLRESGLHQIRPQNLQMIIRLALQRLLPGACLSMLNLLDLAWQYRNATGDATVFDAMSARILSEYQILDNLFTGKQPKAKSKDQSETSQQPEPPSKSEDKDQDDSHHSKPDWRLKAAVECWINVIKNIRELQPKKTKPASEGDPSGQQSAQKSTSQPQAFQKKSEPNATVDTAAAEEKRIERLSQAWLAFIKSGMSIAYFTAATTHVKIIDELKLWPTQTNLLFKAPPATTPTIDDRSALLARHASYAEAVAILYPRDLEVSPTQSTRTQTAAGPIDVKESSPADLEAKVRALFESGQFEAARRLLRKGRPS
jgi:hypothetical protein